MNRQELQDLRTMGEYPSLSIIAPTHRTAPHNLQDPIRLKNLVTDATSRLLDDFPRRTVAPLLDRLDFLVEQIDWRHTLDGLALFANHDCAAGFDLPFPVTEHFLIGDSFATRELVFAMNRSPHYHLLILGEGTSHLYEADGDVVRESHEADFPISQLLPSTKNCFQVADASEDATARKAYDRAFLCCVDQRVGEAIAEDRLPLIVAGTKGKLAEWLTVSRHQRSLELRLEETPQAHSLHGVTKAAWPVMQQYLAGQRVTAFEDLDDAISAKKYASGIGAVWQTAHDGRCKKLLVERNFQYPAWLHPCGLLLNTIAEGGKSEFMSNAVDNVIERVLVDGGEVVFMDDDSLDEHFHVVGLLRE